MTRINVNCNRHEILTRILSYYYCRLFVIILKIVYNQIENFRNEREKEDQIKGTKKEWKNQTKPTKMNYSLSDNSLCFILFLMKRIHKEYNNTLLR